MPDIGENKNYHFHETPIRILLQLYAINSDQSILPG